MKKLFTILVCLMLAVSALADTTQTPESSEPEYDDLILYPEEHYDEKMLINGTVLEIREYNTDDGHIQALIIIEQMDGPINPVALLYTRHDEYMLGIEEGWRIAFHGVFKEVWNIRNSWGFYVAMPLFENEEGRTIFSVPMDRELPEFMNK